MGKKDITEIAYQLEDIKPDKSELDLYKKSEISLGTVCVSGHRLPAWTDIKMCNEMCPIFEQCKAQKVGELCEVQKNYLGTVLKGAVKKLPKPVDEALLQRIGLILIPLYNDLFLFQLEKSSLMKVMLGSGSNMKLHPIFRVVRETITTIDKQWEIIGLSKLAIKQMKDINGDPLNGDKNYYDTLTS